MSTKRAKVAMPTPEEDAAIQAGIDADPDNPEWTEADFAAARPAAEMLPPAAYAGLVRRRGPGKRPAKVPVTFKLPPDVLERLRAAGPGWQTKAGEALAQLADRLEAAPADVKSAGRGRVS